MRGVTYDVRVYKTRVYRGAKVTTYYVRWKVGGREWTQPFRNDAQADGFRSELVSAARKGEAFSTETGRPASWQREKSKTDSRGPSWYDFARSYAAAKWPYASPNHRRGIAEALIDATEVLTLPDSGAPASDAARRALREWTFSAQIREETKPPANTAKPPADIAPAVQWLEANTIMLADLVGDQGAILARRMLDRISRKRDGGLAAANTANRKRTVLNNAMEYACEIRALPFNPLKQVKWTKRRIPRAVDPGVVINSDQARRFLAAVEAQDARGSRLTAFFGCLYYAALRPEEAIDLRRDHLVRLPGKGWGEMRLTNSEPRSGTRWTDTGQSRERRPLKHRADGDSRCVPLHPELVALLRSHLERFGVGQDNRLFTGPRGGVVAEWAYLGVFHAARKAALSSAEAATPLMRVPYDLRHAAVSTWLNAGVGAPQVADWAGHSVDVLLRVYAKCVAGQQDEDKRRIEEAMNLHVDDGSFRFCPSGDDMAK
jgi:integrase